MIRIICLVIGSLMMFATPVLAKKRADAIRVHVINCSQMSISVNVYNGRDGGGLYKDSKRAKMGGGTVTMRCRGQGKGRCKVEAVAKRTNGTRSTKKKVKNGKWMKVNVTFSGHNVTGITATIHDTKPSCS